MNIATFSRDIRSSHEFFNRSTRLFEESESGFAPFPNMMTVSQQIAHAAQTIHWFIQGAFSPTGFDLDFEAAAREVSQVSSLAAARSNLSEAYATLLEAMTSKAESEWQEPIVQGLIMGGEPRESIFSAIVEHTAHHRGTLTVYSRALGKVPPMPYMDL